jgi:spermidine/putrescine-binding protein
MQSNIAIDAKMQHKPARRNRRGFLEMQPGGSVRIGRLLDRPSGQSIIGPRATVFFTVAPRPGQTGAACGKASKRDGCPALFDSPIAKKTQEALMLFEQGFSRRSLLRQGLVTAAALPLIGKLSPAALAATKGTVQFGDIGVGDPGGDWSKFTAASGYGVNLVAFGNAPSAILNVLIAGGGQGTYDIINIVGGMQKPLVENDLIDEIDTGKMPNWARDEFVQKYLAPGTPGFDFIGYNDKVYGVPTVIQGDAFAYLPEATGGELSSYGALFDPKFKGYVAIEDNYTTAGQKTALYMKSEKLATINDPHDMTPGEIKAVVDFLIEKKKEGQFRVIWNSFEQSVGLLVNKEVYVMDCWEPMVFVANSKGVKAVYAKPKEGFLLWAMAAYIVKNPNRSKEQTEAAYALLDFMLGGWYGAKITSLRGYMTNPQAVDYAKSHSSEFSAEEAARIEAITKGVDAKLAQGGTWQNRWPTHVETYESEWARFKAA